MLTTILLFILCSWAGCFLANLSQTYDLLKPENAKDLATKASSRARSALYDIKSRIHDATSPE